MVGWNVKRRLLVCLISTVCFITIGLQSLTSINWSHKRLMVNDDTDKILQRIERDAGSRQGNVNSARQLASYDNLNNVDLPDGTSDVIVEKGSKAPKAAEGNDTAGKPPAKAPATPIVKDIVATTGRRQNKEVKTDGDQDDEEEFTDCRGNGTVDMGGYPFIDARNIFCGEAPRRGKDSKDNDIVRAPGAITRSLLETMLLGKGTTLQNGGHLTEIYIIGETAIKLTDVSITGEDGLVLAKQFSTVSVGKRRYERKRELHLHDGTTYSTGELYFFPPRLSEYNILMKFLRTLYTACASDGKGASRYATTVQAASVGGKKLIAPFCVYFGLIGGGIKESYVIGTSGCDSMKIPEEIKLCVLKDIKL